MERRETYDPEDIESLLNERSFDELLEEERAFVLRHLSGREEYEAMRGLLHQVRTEEQGPHEPIAADPHIREHVLKVYRERQMPSWRIWLNTVQAFLLPGEAKAFWRPALAIATVLLLVTGGVLVYQRMSNTEETLVAALEEKANTPVPHTAEPVQPPPADAAKNEESPTATAGISRSQAAPAEDLRETLDDSPLKWSATGEVASGSVQSVQTDATFQGLHQAEGNEVLLSANALTPAAADTLMAFAPTMDHEVNYVMKEDLQKNVSLTNATGAVAMDELARVEVADKREERRKRQLDAEKTDELSRSLSQDQRLLELLNAAW